MAPRRRPGVPRERWTQRGVIRFFYQIPARFRQPTYGQFKRRGLRPSELADEVAVLAELRAPVEVE